MNCEADSMLDEDFDAGLHYKARMGSNSGYLDEEYEQTKEFPTLPDYHFRIEDDAQILSLEKLRRESQPIAMQATFTNSSEAFKTRLNELLSGIDSRQVRFSNHMEEERHGYYTLASSYADEEAINSVLEKAKVEDLRVRLAEVTISEAKPVFIKKSYKADKPMSQEQEVRRLSKRLNRITITEDDL